MEGQLEAKDKHNNSEKAKNRVEYIILGLMLFSHLVYFLMPIHLLMAQKSYHGLLGLFSTPPILFEVSLVDTGFVLKSDQIVTKNFRAIGLTREQLLVDVSRKSPIIAVVEDSGLDKLTDKNLVIVEDVGTGSGSFLARYLYPLRYKGKRTSIVLHKVRKPEETAIYAFLRKSYFLGVVKEGNVAALYDRCQSEVMEIRLSNKVIRSSFPE